MKGWASQLTIRHQPDMQQPRLFVVCAFCLPSQSAHTVSHSLQYLPPWGYAPTSTQAAQRQLVREVKSRGGEVVKQASDKDELIRVRIPYGALYAPLH